MASFVFLTDQTTLQSLSGFQTGYVGANATLATPLKAVDLVDSSRLTVAGNIYSGTQAITAMGTGGNVNVVTILDSGSIVGGAFEALFLAGNGEKRVYNYGLLQGAQSAIAISSAFGGAPAVRLINGGQIIGNDATAIFAEGVADLDISNTGEIMGRQFGIYNEFSSAQVRLQNDGVVDGSVAALALGSGDDIIHNRGVISGNASLGGGNDRYDGRLGAQQTVVAAAGFDTVLGGAGDETFFGGDDGDVLKGGGGDDRILGDNAEDMLFGEDGADLLYGGDGNDTAAGGAGADTIEGGLGLDLLNGGADDDVIDAMQDDDTVAGGLGDDTVLGGDGNDVVSGGQGDDSVDGGAGVDNVLGGAGADSLVGGAGNDKLDGGTGDDVLNGGSGADRFIFNRSSGHDQVADFLNNTDRLDLRAFDVASVAALSALSSDSALGLVINLQSLGGGTIVLSGFTLANLDATDVLL